MNGLQIYPKITVERGEACDHWTQVFVPTLMSTLCNWIEVDIGILFYLTTTSKLF